MFLYLIADGRHPAPVDMYNIPWFIGFHTSQVVQDFSHQQYQSFFPAKIHDIPAYDRWAEINKNRHPVWMYPNATYSKKWFYLHYQSQQGVGFLNRNPWKHVRGMSHLKFEFQLGEVQKQLYGWIKWPKTMMNLSGNSMDGTRNLHLDLDHVEFGVTLQPGFYHTLPEI